MGALLAIASRNLIDRWTIYARLVDEASMMPLGGPHFINSWIN